MCYDIETILKLIKGTLTTKIDQQTLVIKNGIVYAKKWNERQKIIDKHGIKYVKIYY